MHRKLAQTLALPAVAVMALLGGCRSDDQHEFAMPLDRSGTVTIMDALSEETLWTKPLPPGQKLVLNFERDGAFHDDEFFTTKGGPANEVHWSQYAHGKKVVVNGQPWGKPLGYGTVDLPGTPVRVEVTYERVKPGIVNRVAPTIAPETAPATTPPPAAEAEEAPVLINPPAPAPPAPEPEMPAPTPAPEPEAAPAPAPTPTPAPAPEAAPAPAPVDDPAFK